MNVNLGTLPKAAKSRTMYEPPTIRPEPDTSQMAVWRTSWPALVGRSDLTPGRSRRHEYLISLREPGLQNPLHHEAFGTIVLHRFDATN
jgi:hypothetical protein